MHETNLSKNLQIPIKQFVKNYPDNGLEILAQLIIGNPINQFVGDFVLDRNFDKIICYLKIRQLESSMKTLILEEICAQTKIENNFTPTYSYQQSLAWFYRQKISGITSLNFCSIDLMDFGRQGWTVFLAGLKISGISSLDLGKNNLWLLSPEEWVVFFAASRNCGITLLKLSENSLCKNPYTWTAFLTGLENSGISSLDLSNNNLYELTPHQWTDFFAGLENSDISSLDLSNNNLYELTPDQWNAFSTGLSLSKITKLDVFESIQLNNDRIQQLQKIIESNIRKLGLEEGKGLQNLCAFSFWKTPGAKVEAIKNSDDTETYVCKSEIISQPKEVCEDIGKLLQHAEKSKSFGVHYK